MNDVPQFSDDTIEAFRTEVEAGGVYWWCETCGAQGAVAALSPWAVQVRTLTNTPAPELIGVAIDKEDCIECNAVRH